MIFSGLVENQSFRHSHMSTISTRYGGTGLP